MKFLCFIVSIYVLVLSSTPCCSEDKCLDERNTEQNDHSSNEKDSDCNACSPFFTCGTCSGFALSDAELTFEKVTVVLGKFVSLFKSALMDEFLVTIWQPPK